MKVDGIHPRLLAATLVLACVPPALAAADVVSAGTHRVLWHNRRLLGSPEPPPPYRVEKTFQKIAWKAPMYVAAEPGTDQLWVVLQGGEKERPSRVVRVQDNPEVAQPELVLEMAGRLIYGLTFHPGYATNRLVFVFSNGPTGSGQRTNYISHFTVTNRAPFACDRNSEQTILEWASAGHDGGDLAFGRDGMLYCTSGDGTSDSDGLDSGQDLSNLLATLIRIDVEHPSPGRRYAVPKDNPFLNVPGARPEIWAYGFRNPWRMDIDRKTGDIWVGNNGQDLWETAHLVRRGDNFGWSVFEGSHPFHAQRRRGPTPIVPPTIEHHHAEARSLTGGVVYYGDALPDLNGAYVYGDYATGKIWGARHRNGRLVWHQELVDTTLQIAAFRASHRGELLVVDHGGGLYRLTPARDRKSRTRFPTRLSDTGLFSSLKDHRADPGLIPYSVNVSGWADGATAERFIALPGAAKIGYASSRGWNFTNDTVLVQTLSLTTGRSRQAKPRRMETRVLLKQEGEWAGYSYRWNDAQTEATLVGKAGEEIPLEVPDPAGGTRRQIWRIPSRTDCLACHARAVNFVLGLTEPQMNRARDRRHGTEPTNQLTYLASLGALSGFSNPKPETLSKLVDPYDAAGTLDQRARSYLHANCSVCHVEAGGGNSRMELEFTRARDSMHVIGDRPQHDTFGMTNAMIVAPGEPDRSVLLHRVGRRGQGQMPPLMTARVDERAVALFRDWIAGMPPQNPFVRDWTLDELLPALGEIDAGRSSAAGKAVFQKVGCVQCHRFGGEGGAVGPDLTGISRRLARRELLESIVDPSKVIADEYAAVDIETRRGDVVTGRVEREDARELVLRTGSALEELVHLRKADILKRRKSAVSNMPAGMLNVLERGQILDLLAYLVSDAPQTGSKFDFTRLVAHWAGYGNTNYLNFIADAQPEVVQVGFYGAHFWSLVHTPHYGGYPAHFPVRGITEASAWFAELNRKVHERGAKVVGHFNVEFLVGDPESPEGPRGFFHFYRNLWDPAVLGPKPEADPISLLEKNRDGTPIVANTYGIGGMKEYWACLRNPSWQKVLKAWIRRGIELGLDGFVANYFYRHDCTCDHCVRAFREYLRARFSAQELQAGLGIADLAQHKFEELVSWHDPAKSSPLRREMLRFSQISNKEVFDEVFVRYGRSLKPDLLVAQWNHLGDFSQVSGDERCLLPAELWGRDEDYLWYSLGGSANFTDLARDFLGEGTLHARYIRGAFDDKPFTLGKYESTRIRVSIAELAANGGAPMGFYTDFAQPAAREIIVSYYQFLKRHAPLWRANRSAAEAALIFPRRAVHRGDLEPLQQFRDTGRALLDAHVLFDVIPDDLADPGRLGSYAHVFHPTNGPAAEWLAGFTNRSRFHAPKTVRVSASQPAQDTNEWDIHFVNYNRTEPPKAADGNPSPGAGAQDEKPIAARDVRAELRLPGQREPVSVQVLIPEQAEPVSVPFEVSEGWVRFAVPEFLVYAVARVQMKEKR